MTARGPVYGPRNYSCEAPPGIPQALFEKIRQRRCQMLIHSYLYYKLNEEVVTDADWQRWADELTGLQLMCGTKIGWYDEAFVDWTGSTGMHLPQDAWVQRKAESLI